MTDSDPPLPHPTPRRYYDIASLESSPPTPRRSNTTGLDPDTSESQANNRSRSILNLTSSTLFGIYSPTSDESVRWHISTPFGNGAETPRLASTEEPISLDAALRKPSPQNVETPKTHASCINTRPPLILRLPLLFICGVAYGLIITHLHDDQQLAPVKVDHIDRNSWRYLMLWGSAGVVLGGLLPWVDKYWEGALGVKSRSKLESPVSGGDDVDEDEPVSGSGGANWNQVVRGVGAFVGIAFAIVSTLSLGSKDVANLTSAQTPLAVYSAGLAHLGIGQPVSMVPRRSLETRVLSFLVCWYNRYCGVAWAEPRYDAPSTISFAPGGRQIKQLIRQYHA